MKFGDLGVEAILLATDMGFGLVLEPGQRGEVAPLRGTQVAGAVEPGPLIPDGLHAVEIPGLPGRGEQPLQALPVGADGVAGHGGQPLGQRVAMGPEDLDGIWRVGRGPARSRGKADDEAYEDEGAQGRSHRGQRASD